MKIMFIKFGAFFLCAGLTIYSVAAAQGLKSEEATNASSRNYWMGVEAGVHSKNFAEFDHTGEGITLRLNVFSIPVVSVSRLQLAITYSHAEETYKFVDLGGALEAKNGEYKSSVDLTGVELYYGASIFSEKNWNFLVGPQIGIENMSSHRGGLYSIGLAGVLELNSPKQMMQYYMRVFGKTGAQLLNVGGNGTEYNVFGVSLGIGFNLGQILPRKKMRSWSNASLENEF